jgi:hypothetical protein
MKLAAPLLLASAHGSTLFGPIYEMVADQLVSQVTGIIRDQADTGVLATPAALKGAVDSFADALDDMDRSALVDIMKNIDPNELYTDDGSFNPDALSVVFDLADDPALKDMAADLQTQFSNSFLDTVDKNNDMKAAMNSFLDLSSTFTDIMNNEIEPSNFVAIINDFTTGLTKFDDAFGNELLGGTLNTVIDAVNVVSTIGEKGLVVWETLAPLEEGFGQARAIAEYTFQNTLENANNYDPADGLWCTKAKHGIIDAEREFFEFLADVAIPNYKIPIMDSLNMWNDFVHGIEFLDMVDFTDSVEMLESMMDQAIFYSEAAASSLQEINILAMPFNAQIKSALEGAFC